VEDDQYIALGVVAGYALMLWITRWRFVARPNFLLALAKIESVRARCTDEDGQDQKSMELLARAKAYVRYKTEDDGDTPLLRLARGITWNGSRELVGWGLAHEVERRLVDHLSAEEVYGRLGRGLTEIPELPDTDWDHWRDELADARKPLVSESHNGTMIDRVTALAQARATLQNFLKALYDRRNERFVELSTAENKVTWLILVALLLLTVLIIRDVTVVLAAGAIGGILSRLRRVVQREPVLSDYGMSWALHFLAPIAGALSAWAGLLLLLALQEADIIQVNFLEGGQPLRDPNASVLAVAVLLGFFERFFEKLASHTAGSTV
jgi:uncharacterized integral membrane protein